MGFLGYVCPPGAPTNEFQRPGQQNPIAHCLGRCPSPCVSPPLLAAMWTAEQRNHHKGAYISVSQFKDGGCPRQTWYERQPHVDFYELARKRFWPFRGTVIHGLIEKAGPVLEAAGWMQELRMQVPLTFHDLPAPVFDDNGVWTGEYDYTKPLVITIGGTTDAYNPFIKALHDFKTTSDTKLADFLAGAQGGSLSTHIKDEWVMQVNIYSWMVGRTPIEPHHRAAFAAHGLKLPDREHFPRPIRLSMQVISMMEIPLTGTSYVVQRSHTPVEIPDVPVLQVSEIVAYVRRHALQWYQWLVLGEQPPVLPKKSRGLCKSCAFNGELTPGGPCLPNAV